MLNFYNKFALSHTKNEFLVQTSSHLGSADYCVNGTLRNSEE